LPFRHSAPQLPKTRIGDFHLHVADLQAAGDEFEARQGALLLRDTAGNCVALAAEDALAGLDPHFESASVWRRSAGALMDSAC